jgi:hypothetical protein
MRPQLIGCHTHVPVTIQNVSQQDVYSLTTCSWDRFEPKSSNEHGSNLQWFVKTMRMSILLHL